MMAITQNHFGEIFHGNMYIKFNKLYLIFKNVNVFSPYLILLYYVVDNIWIFPIVISIFLLSWILSVKMRSLRNINYHAYINFRKLRSKELNEMFR